MSFYSEQISYCTNLNFGFAQLEWTFAPVSLHWFYKLMPVESWHIPAEKGSIYIPSKQTDNSKSTFRSLKAGTRSYSPSDLYPTEDSLATNVKRKQLSEDVRICASAGKCWDKIRNILQGQSSAKEWLVSDVFFRDRRLQHTNRFHF
jgi:hypothetical protein